MPIQVYCKCTNGSQPCGPSPSIFMGRGCWVWTWQVKSSIMASEIIDHGSLPQLCSNSLGFAPDSAVTGFAQRLRRQEGQAHALDTGALGVPRELFLPPGFLSVSVHVTNRYARLDAKERQSRGGREREEDRETERQESEKERERARARASERETDCSIVVGRTHAHHLRKRVDR